MTFSGRVYWVSDGHDYAACYDSATQAYTYTTIYQSSMPKRSNGWDRNFGVTTRLGDGHLFIRTEPDNDGVDDVIAIIVDADLKNPTTIHFPNPYGGANYIGYEYGGGTYDAATDLNWVYWFDGNNTWTGFDNTGAAVRSVGDATIDNEVLQTGHRTNAVIRDRWLYSNIYDFGEWARYNLDDGRWQKAGFGYDYISSCLIGSCDAGLVFVNTSSSDARCGYFTVVAPETMTWFDVGTPLSDFPAPTVVYDWAPQFDLTLAEFVNNAWWTSIAVADNVAYFAIPNIGTAWGADANGVPYGSYCTIWSVDLLTGAQGTFLELPYQCLNADGSLMNHNDPYYTDTRQGVASIIFAPTVTPALTGALADNRRFFVA